MIIEEIDHFIRSAFNYRLTKYLTNTLIFDGSDSFDCGLLEFVCKYVEV